MSKLYTHDRHGFPITGIYHARKIPFQYRQWTIYGWREGVSANVLVQACDTVWRTKRDVEATIKANRLNDV